MLNGELNNNEHSRTSLDKLIDGRRSIRKYKTDMPPSEWIDKIIYSATRAPSPSNSQPVRFIRISSHRIKNELEPDEIDVERGMALVMIVGEGMRFTIGVSARATRAFLDGKVNIEMTNQGSSEISMMFGIREVDRSAAVKALYDEFFSD